MKENYTGFGNFATVRQHCLDEGIELHPDIIEAARDQALGNKDMVDDEQDHANECYTPTASHAAFAAACELYLPNGNGTGYRRPLASSPIRCAVPDSATRHIVNLLNSEHGELAPRQPAPEAAFERVDSSQLNSCEWSDARFAEIFTTLSACTRHELDGTLAQSRLGFQLFMITDKPLLLRKTGIPSAISFAPVTVNDLLYPAGTLFKVEPYHAYDASRPVGSELFQKAQRGHAETLNANWISRITPLRLSIFADRHHTERRLHTGLSEISSRAEIVARHGDIAELRKQAARVARMIRQPESAKAAPTPKRFRFSFPQAHRV